MNQTIVVDSGLGRWILDLKDTERANSVLETLSGDFTDFFGRPLGVYPFKEGMGLCGILLPNGHFLKCKDSQHSLLSSLLKEHEKFLSIFFSSKLIYDKDMSVVTLYLTNNGGMHGDKFNRERALMNNGLHNNLSDVDGKILVTQSQLSFIKKHYGYLNKSQREILSILLYNSCTELTDLGNHILSDNIVALDM